jgi:hypothetical protein
MTPPVREVVESRNYQHEIFIYHVEHRPSMHGNSKPLQLTQHKRLWPYRWLRFNPQINRYQSLVRAPGYRPPEVKKLNHEQDSEIKALKLPQHH